MPVTISGLFSGLDTTSLIAQLTALNRVPIQELQTRRSELSTSISAYGFVGSSLSSLNSRLDALTDPTLFDRRSATLSNSAVGSATASSTAALGTTKIEVTRLATSSQLTGGKLTAPPAASATLEQTFGSGAAGTLTVNGTEVTLSGNMTLEQAASAITAAVPTVNAAYNATSGKFELSSSNPILLGSGTSSFLRDAQLFNNGTGTVTSTNGVGRASTSSTLGTLFGAGTGSITVNGTSIGYSSTDTLQDMLSRITGSEAGVVASYDSYNDKVLLTSKSRGSNAITVADSTGTLAQAMKLRTGSGGEATVALGDETRFKVNGGAERSSADATLDEGEIGVAGLSFSASQVGTTDITVGSDVSAVQSAIDAFVDQYNSTQSMIASYIKVTPGDASASGALASDTTLTFLPSEMRSVVGGQLLTSGSARMLEDIGVVGNADNATLTRVDATKLKAALESDPDGVRALFADATNGLSARLKPVIEAYSGNGVGAIDYRTTSLTSQQSQIDRDIEQMELRVAAETEYLQSQFALLESVSSQSQQFSSFFQQSATS